MFKHITDERLAIARDAGKLALRLQKAGGPVRRKSAAEGDVATAGDDGVRDFVKPALLKTEADAEYISEETIKDRSVNYKKLHSAFVIDEIDGSGNHEDGNENWAISIGIVVDGEPVAGIIYQPAVDKLYYGEIGVGAFCKVGDKVVKLAKIAPVHLDDAGVIYSLPYTTDEQPHARMEALIEALTKKGIKLNRLKSQVVELMQVAEGRSSIFLMNWTKPWDVAAAVAILRAMGYSVWNMRGEEYQLGEPTIIAGDIEDLDSLLELTREA